MKRLLSSTTALSLAVFNVQPWPLMAQTLTADGYVVAADGSVLCAPSEGAECNPGDYIDAAMAIEAAIAAEAEAAAQAEAEAAAQAEADAAAQAEAEAAAQAEAEAAAQAEAEAAAQAEAEAAAQAEAEAAAQAEADAAAQAEAEAAAQAEAEAAAQAEAEAAAQAEADAAAQAEAEAAAQAEAEAAAQAEAEAAAQAEADAAVQAEADAAAQAEAEAAAQAEAEAAAQAEADAAAQAEADAAAQAEADAAAQAEAEAAAQAEDDAAAQAEADAAAQAEADAAAQAEVDAAAQAEVDAAAQAEADAAAQAEADAAQVEDEAAAQALAEAEAELKVEEDGTLADPAAGLRTAEPVVADDVAPIDVPVVSEAEVESLSELLTEPDQIDPTAIEAAAALAETPQTEGEAVALQDIAPAAGAIGSVTEVLTEETTRTSSQEFAAAPRAVGDGKKSGLSDLEKVGLIALGALVVGTIINDIDNERDKRDRRVVSNTGDRVVVLNPDGTYQVYKDDDTVIRQPGSTVRTETFRDGSTRTIVERRDGTQIVTIRDATGRVLRRAQYDELGRELVLIDDLEPEEVVYIEDLPKPRKNKVVISTEDDDADLKAALAAKDIEKIGRKFSLRQIREIAEVRALAATIDVDAITFDSGSSAIQADEAEDLADLGSLMQEMIDENPAEMFLIEGHTDAVGKAAMNLALSDRRAESVALALTEYFDIPPENMVIQGYGESELRIDTDGDEKRNRRVAVRIITPLLKTSK